MSISIRKGKMARLRLLALFLFCLAYSGAEECVENNTDIEGDNLNDGLADKKTDPNSCHDFCSDSVPGSKYFVWTSPEFFDAYYHNACWCKANKKSSFPAEGAVAGVVDCNNPGQDDCFDHDVDIEGDNINDGLENTFADAESCQNFCLTKIAGAKFFTWADSSFFDPLYHLSCFCKADARDKKDTTGIVSGPVDCDAAGGCCRHVYLDSDGLLADSEQKHVIGNYYYHSDGPDGRANYKQVEESQQYLYYMPTLGVSSQLCFRHSLTACRLLHVLLFTLFSQRWYVGDVIGVNLCYASNLGTAVCPEDLGPDWEYWGFDTTGDWVADPLAYVECRA